MLKQVDSLSSQAAPALSGGAAAPAPPAARRGRNGSDSAKPESSRLGVTLSPEQTAWIESEAVRRSLPKSAVLRELVGAAFNAPAPAASFPPAGGPVGFGAVPVSGVPPAVPAPVPRSYAGNGAAQSARADKAPPLGVSAAAAASARPPEPAPAEAPAHHPSLVSPYSAAPLSDAPLGRPAADPVSSIVPVAGPGGTAPPFIVMLPGPDGALVPCRVPQGSFAAAAAPYASSAPGLDSWAAAFKRLHPVVRYGSAAAVVLTFLMLFAALGSSLMSTRYEFRQVSSAPGRSATYKVDRWTGRMVRCRTDASSFGIVC